MIIFEDFSNALDDIIKNICVQENIPDGFLSVSDNKDGSRSLFIIEPVTDKKSRMILKFSKKIRKQQLNILVRTSRLEQIGSPENAETELLTSDPQISKIIFSGLTDSILKFVEKLVSSEVADFEPSEKFGCCHRYKECSDAEKCLHPNKFYSKACWYKKNLEQGKIFY